MMVKINTDAEIGYIQPELHSQFIEFLGTCIYDGIWVGEDSDIPNYEGLRKDVVDALKEIEPPVIRWPGGCYADTYHWRNGIGEKSSRPVTYNENFGTYELDSNQFGTHEFMKLCQLVGAKPWFNVNMMSGSVAEMREWMEYCKRDGGTSLAAEREQNGSREPFQIELWGIGNEVWAGGGFMTAQSYAAEYRKYATAFPSFISLDGEENRKRPKLKRIACGPDGNKKKERVQWTKDFFKEMADYRCPAIDAYDLHFYNWNIEDLEKKETEFSEQEWYSVINSCLELEEIILEQAELIKEGLDSLPEEEGFFKAPEPKCDLIVGEWGNWHGAAFKNRPALYQQCTMRDAITSALTLDIFHRNCGCVKMACVAQTVNVLNSLILTDKEKCIRTPNYDVFSMYKVHRGATALEVEVQDEKLFAFASRKEHVINVNLVNVDFAEGKEIELQLPESAEFCSGTVLKGDEPASYNSFDNPERIRKTEAEEPEKIASGFRMKLPPASVSAYQFMIG